MVSKTHFGSIWFLSFEFHSNTRYIQVLVRVSERTKIFPRNIKTLHNIKKYNEFYFSYRQKDQCLSDMDFYRLVSNLQTGLAKTEFYHARLWREENPGKEDPHFLHLLLSPTYDINVFISCYVLKHEILNVKKVQ